MARREAENLIGRLRQMSEEGAASFFSELMANETLRKRLGKAGEQILNNKQSFDRNVGKGSPLGLERGINDLWTRGGLMYALPLR